MHRADAVMQKREKHRWIALDPTRPANGGLSKASINQSYQDAAIFADVPAPEVTSFAGKAKFLPDVDGRSESLGYQATLRLSEVPKDKIPDHYKKTTEIKSGWTLGTPDHFTYNATLKLILKDADGFPLLEVRSQSVELVSGVDNNFKQVLPNTIPPGVADRASSIAIEINFEKCLTCAS